MVQPPSVVTFAWLTWPVQQLHTVFNLWQDFFPKADRRLTGELFMSSQGGRLR